MAVTPFRAIILKQNDQYRVPMTEIPSQPLTGKALLQKIESMSHLSKRDLAKRCGYVSTTKTGKLRVKLTDFYDAVLAANGVPTSPNSGRDRRGREPTFRVSVHKNGQLIIGSAYTEKMGLQPGDEFEIHLGYKHIRLKQVLGNPTGADGENED